jgi:hypothetical protein
MPAGSQQPDSHSVKSWELSEDGRGFLRSQDEAHADISRIYSHSGTLLTETSNSALGKSADVSATTSAGGRLGRLLRYYMANGRRVVLHDVGGARWAARIISTRWHANKRVWSFRSTGHKLSAKPDHDSRKERREHR